MRYRHEKIKRKPLEYGDRRIRSKFLLFPKTINGVTRWLEKAVWTERFEDQSTIEDWYFPSEPAWVAVGWAD